MTRGEERRGEEEKEEGGWGSIYCTLTIVFLTPSLSSPSAASSSSFQKFSLLVSLSILLHYLDIPHFFSSFFFPFFSSILYFISTLLLLFFFLFLSFPSVLLTFFSSSFSSFTLFFNEEVCLGSNVPSTAMIRIENGTFFYRKGK